MFDNLAIIILSYCPENSPVFLHFLKYASALMQYIHLSLSFKLNINNVPLAHLWLYTRSIFKPTKVLNFNTDVTLSGNKCQCNKVSDNNVKVNENQLKI